jgi:CheY-like chemotaxis protein
MAKVLLVDDDANVLRVVEIALQASGHEVRTATGPDPALALLPEFRPDLMVVDVMMPSGTEGFHLVWALRQLDDEQLKNTPVIMATGIHETTDLRFYPEQTDGTYKPGEYLPIQGWIDKPVKVAELNEKIAAVLKS